MSKLRCHCGNIITDQTDDLAFKGEITADQDWEALWGNIAERVPYLTPAEAADFLTALRLRLTRTTYECVNCGRLWIERRPGLNEFICFHAESDKYEGILQSTEPVRHRSIE